MDKVRVGVVGLGGVAQVVHLPILTKLPDADVIAVCDRDPAKARLVGEKFGFKRTYTDVGQMIANEGLHAIIVATSTDAHKEATVAALRGGCDVLVEKPIARRYAEAVEMADLARELKRKLMVGMNHRFRPDTMLLKSFVEAKEIGKLFYTKCGWLRKRSSDSAWATQKEKAGGGVFVDLGIPMLDLSFWLMGFPDVRRVSASHFYHKTKSVEDTSLVSLTLKNGSLINIEVSWSLIMDEDVYYCYIFGSEGTASLNPLRVNKELHGNLVNLAPAKMDSVQHLFRRSYENELKYFLGAVRNLHPVISTGDEAVARMKVVDAVYKSFKTGKEVVFA
ncbi:MAG: Gfo/Idh/MocA family oxidoreductase [Bacteroidota bacterium]